MKEIFEKLLMELISVNTLNNCIENYSSLADEEKVKFTLRLLLKCNISPDVILHEKKSAAKSTEFKNKADKLYTMSLPGMKLQLDSIIENYTKSVAFAPPESRELSLAYANRSAALFKARLYDDCLQDIERALKLDYPDRLKAKLFVRKSRCLIAQNSSKSESEEALKAARHWLNKMDLEDAGREIVEKTLNDPKQMESTGIPRIILEDDRNLPEIPKDNPEIPGASSAIELKYSQEFGKHVVATRDIDPGEVIVVQQAYASIVDIEKSYSHCENCLKQTWSAIPCNHCVEAIYCSEACRDAAYNDYHDVECQLIGPLTALNIDNGRLLAMRLVVKAVKEAGSLQTLKNKLAIIDSSTDLRTQGFTEGILNDRKYASVYTLETNAKERLFLDDLLMASLESIYMLYMLATRSKMFGKKLDGDWDTLVENEWVTFIGGLIMRHDQINATNARSVDGINKDSDTITIGTAIVPFTSFFNHSCSPMVSHYSTGRNFIIFTMQFIKKGEQIFDYYGPNYMSMSKTVRQKELKENYHFLCECIACREDWPLFENLQSYQEQKLSKQVEDKLNAKMKVVEKYENLARVGDVENKPEVIEELKNMIKLFSEHVHFPCQEMARVQSLLNITYAWLGIRLQSLD